MVNVLDSVVFPISGGGTYSTLINEATTLSNITSGYYYTDTLSDHININCGSLSTGQKVLWFNDSTKKVIFNGLTSIDGTSIDVNKGVNLAPNGYVELNINSTGIATKIRGDYTIDWIAGYNPPFVTRSYSSLGDTNGILYFIGTQKETTSWQRPDTLGAVTLIVSPTLGSGWEEWRAIDRNSGTRWQHAGNPSNPNFTFDFAAGSRPKITRYTLNLNSSDLVSFFPSWTFSGSNDGSNWTTLHSDSVPTTGITNYVSPIFTNTTEFRYYSFRNISGGSAYKQMAEIEFYGEAAN